MKIDQSDFIRESKSMTRIMYDKPGLRPPESAPENRVARYRRRKLINLSMRREPSWLDF